MHHDEESGSVAAEGSDVLPDVHLSEVIGALSYALDLTEGQPPGHCQRCCWIGSRLGRALDLPEPMLQELYYTLLLKDAGCSSNAERLFELYACDDRETKRDWARVDTNSLEQLARFVFTHAAPGRGLRPRLRHLFRLLRHGEALADEVVLTRCERGAGIARQLGFGENVAEGIRRLDEHWDGRGRPQRLKGQKIPVTSRIALLAQVADVFYQTGGAEAARTEVRRRSGTWFDPLLVDTFDDVSREPDFWDALDADDFVRRLWDLEPVKSSVAVDEQRLDDIALAFAQVVDAKSHFTYGHSERVGEYAGLIAAELGMAPEAQRLVRRAGLLHDLGKLGVSNAILDKPGRLDAAEWEQVKRHPGQSEVILARIGAFRELAGIAGAHHERLDGYGYPRGLRAARIRLETRIVTVADVLDALTADRPYRAALPLDEALGIMAEERGAGLDPDCLDALQRCLPAVRARLASEGPRRGTGAAGQRAG